VIRLEAPSRGFEPVANWRIDMGTESAEEVGRAMRGDHDAFAALIGLVADRLYAMACLILRDNDRAEDAAQEAIVRAWLELPRLRDPEKFDAWLRKLTVNACFDEARRITRRAEVSLIRLADRTTADHAGAYVEHDRVDQAFRRLPFDQRTVLVLQHHFDLSHTEIAETLGFPLGTVKARIRYGSAALRASLDADDRQSWAASGGTSA
jgi:RNA polymerase sigma-70 factor (ECF subfamily)